MNNVILLVENLKSWYEEGNLVLKDVSFHINNNENVALVGSNGSGKTTLIKTLMDIHPKFSVKNMKFMDKGSDFSDENFKLNRIAVFTEDNSFKYWTFEEYNNFLHKSYNRNFDKSYEEYMIEEFNFKKHLKKPCKDLSTGNKKKFFIIAAMSLKLPLVLLDEPVDGLDFESTSFLYKLIKKYKKYGSVFMSSHILESINESCDQLVLLKDGYLSEKKELDGRLNMEDIMKVFKGEEDD